MSGEVFGTRVPVNEVPVELEGVPVNGKAEVRWKELCDKRGAWWQVQVGYPARERDGTGTGSS